ncbi:hypothetical protein FB451DRAFT_1338236 [Mycena latifolia]|nr:hypothetical protein FB451DRAFT_1338236 [Mycena latifolia]
MNINGDGFYGTTSLLPVVDGEFIAQRSTLALAQGKVSRSWEMNPFEGTIFVNQSTMNATQYALDLYPNFGPVQADRVGALYAGLGTQLFQSNAVCGESSLEFLCISHVEYLLRVFSGRAFKGEFAVPEGLHGRDLPARLPHFDNTAFIDAFTQSFISFTISLDLNIKVDPTTITPAWRKWNGSDVPDVRPVRTSDALLERCPFGNSVGDLTGQ